MKAVFLAICNVVLMPVEASKVLSCPMQSPGNGRRHAPSGLPPLSLRLLRVAGEQRRAPLPSGLEAFRASLTSEGSGL